LGGTAVAQALMQALVVVELEISIKRLMHIQPVIERPQIDALVLDAPPEPLHECVVRCPASAVAADGNPLILKPFGESPARELNPLVAVEYLRLTPATQGSVQRGEAKARFQRVGQLPA